MIENIFDSPKLARKLKIKHCTDCVGTVILDIKNVPKILKDKKLEKEEIIARYSCPFRALKWHDKRNITMASTYHGADTQRVRNKSKETDKTVCVMEYNQKILGVEFKDHLLQMFMVERKRYDQKFPQSFRKATEVYSSKFVSCLSTRNKLNYKAALVKCSVIDRSVYEICACWGDAEYNGGARHLTIQFHG